MTNSNTHEVDVLLIGRSINLSMLNKKIESHYFVKRYRDALYISLPTSDCFIFDYGVVITWGMAEAKKKQLLEYTIPCVARCEEVLRWESMPYSVTQGTTTASISDDHLTVPNKKTLTLLAISHALAQSSKLEQFEAIAERKISDNAYLSETLAKSGKIPLNRKKLAMLRGALFQTRSDILLHFNLLDTPEFFWEYPDQEAHYLAVANYFELKQRTELLTLKLETIHSLVDMLASEQNHKHSAFLEWIIIILIAVDIIVYFH